MNIAVLDVDGFQTCFGSVASAFASIELAFIHGALKENFSVTPRGGKKYDGAPLKMPAWEASTLPGCPNP